MPKISQINSKMYWHNISAKKFEDKEGKSSISNFGEDMHCKNHANTETMILLSTIAEVGRLHL